MSRIFSIIFGRLSTNDRNEPEWSRRVRFATRFAAGGLALAFLFLIPFGLPERFTVYATAVATLPPWLAGLLVIMVLIGLIGFRITSNGRRDGGEDGGSDGTRDGRGDGEDDGSEDDRDDDRGSTVRSNGERTVSRYGHPTVRNTVKRNGRSNVRWPTGGEG